MAQRAGLITILCALLLAAYPLALSVRPALACSCAQATPATNAARADAVFTGTVAWVNPDPRSGRFGLMESTVARVMVEKVYKGDVPASIDVSTSGSGASCGFDFQQGQRYTVFARATEGKLSTNLCSGNVQGSIQPIQYGLLDGGPPPAGRSGISEETVQYLGLAAGLVLLAAILGGIWLTERRSES